MKWTKSFYCEHNIYFFLLQNFGQNLWRKLLRKKNIFPKYCFHNDNISGQSWAFRVNIVEEIYCELNEEIFDILSFYYDKWKFVWSIDERNQEFTDETIVSVYWNSINLYWNWEIHEVNNNEIFKLFSGYLVNPNYFNNSFLSQEFYPMISII